jgi:hypothetical protein
MALFCAQSQAMSNIFAAFVVAMDRKQALEAA